MMAEFPLLTRREALACTAAFTLNLADNTKAGEPGKKTKTGFVPPNEEQRLQALGPLKGLAPERQRAFQASPLFEPMPNPEPGEWLAEHHEAGQSFDQYAKSKPNRPDSKRNTIYLLPFGDFDPDWSPALSDLEICANRFFQVRVKSLPAKSLNNLEITSRERSGGRRQYLTLDFLLLLGSLLPADGFALLGITMEDLYPDAKWNYVFGQASLRERVGIYSFARYDPHFWGQERTPQARTLLMIRSLGVLLHETCHMFGMSHCIYYRCVVNGSNHLEESDKTPLSLCPICLRKLHHGVGFNILAREESLLKEYERLQLTDEAGWQKRRVQQLRG